MHLSERLRDDPLLRGIPCIATTRKRILGKAKFAFERNLMTALNYWNRRYRLSSLPHVFSVALVIEAEQEVMLFCRAFPSSSMTASLV